MLTWGLHLPLEYFPCFTHLSPPNTTSPKAKVLTNMSGSVLEANVNGGKVGSPLLAINGAMISLVGD